MRLRPGKKADKAASSTVPAEVLLDSIVHQNAAMTVKPTHDGGCLATIPIQRPKWLVPPISWLLPFSAHRRVELDSLGVHVMNLIDGKRSVEEIIEKFASINKLTFREAQVAVMSFLKSLTQRGMVAIVGRRRDPRG